MHLLTARQRTFFLVVIFILIHILFFLNFTNSQFTNIYHANKLLNDLNIKDANLINKISRHKLFSLISVPTPITYNNNSRLSSRYLKQCSYGCNNIHNNIEYISDKEPIEATLRSEELIIGRYNKNTNKKNRSKKIVCLLQNNEQNTNFKDGGYYWTKIINTVNKNEFIKTCIRGIRTSVWMHVIWYPYPVIELNKIIDKPERPKEPTVKGMESNKPSPHHTPSRTHSSTSQNKLKHSSISLLNPTTTSNKYQTKKHFSKFSHQSFKSIKITEPSLSRSQPSTTLSLLFHKLTLFTHPEYITALHYITVFIITCFTRIDTESLVDIVPYELFQNIKMLQSNFKSVFDADITYNINNNIINKNIFEIIQTIPCERCKLWGHIQFMGLSTAFIINNAHYNINNRHTNCSIRTLKHTIKLTTQAPSIFLETDTAGASKKANKDNNTLTFYDMKCFINLTSRLLTSISICHELTKPSFINCVIVLCIRFYYLLCSKFYLSLATLYLFLATTRFLF
ncbi:hypothetical protein CDIK_1368 [Cucumispora dikerogammari]|nr:hypothetical protein CDIK_1368 [Cucumispora dikerogammari]